MTHIPCSWKGRSLVVTPVARRYGRFYFRLRHLEDRGDVSHTLALFVECPDALDLGHPLQWLDLPPIDQGSQFRDSTVSPGLGLFGEELLGHKLALGFAGGIGKPFV